MFDQAPIFFFEKNGGGFRQIPKHPNHVSTTNQFDEAHIRQVVFVLKQTISPHPALFARQFNTIPTPTPDARQPGEKQALLDSFLRVDHAGEYGAVRIYEGQLAVLGKCTIGPQLLEMKEHEVAHLKTLQDVMPERRVRPTLLLPVWHVAGYALGTVHVLFHYNSCSLV